MNKKIIYLGLTLLLLVSGIYFGPGLLFDSADEVMMKRIEVQDRERDSVNQIAKARIASEKASEEARLREKVLEGYEQAGNDPGVIQEFAENKTWQEKFDCVTLHCDSPAHAWRIVLSESESIWILGFEGRKAVSTTEPDCYPEEFYWVRVSGLKILETQKLLTRSKVNRCIFGSAGGEETVFVKNA